MKIVELQPMRGSGKTTMQRALGAVEKIKPVPPTHTVYTPVWEPVWEPDEGQFTAGKFRAWLAVGDAWQDDSGRVIFEMYSQPINPEATATGWFYSIPIGRPKPERLTITRDEFLEQQFAAHHHAQ
jgi:hypothetical protein